MQTRAAHPWHHTRSLNFGLRWAAMQACTKRPGFAGSSTEAARIDELLSGAYLPSASRSPGWALTSMSAGRSGRYGQAECHSPGDPAEAGPLGSARTAAPTLSWDAGGPCQPAHRQRLGAQPCWQRQVHCLLPLAWMILAAGPPPGGVLPSQHWRHHLQQHSHKWKQGLLQAWITATPSPSTGGQDTG